MAVVNTAASDDFGGFFQQLGQRLAQQRISNAYTGAYDQSQLPAPQPPAPTGLGQLAGTTPNPSPTPAAAPSTGLASLAPPVPPPQPAAPQQPTVSPGAPSSGPLPSFAALQGGSPQSNVGQMFSGLEQRYNLPQGYLAQTAQIESNGNPNAVNKGSGAAGLFQFVPSTAKQFGLTDPTNVVQSSIAAAQLASNNANVLRQALGREPTAGDLYLAHQQGAAGAAKLLANPNAPAASIVGQSAVTSNGGNPNMTAGQFASLWTSRFDGTPAGGGQTQVASAAPSSPYGDLSGSPFGSMLGARAAVAGNAPATLPTFANGAPPMVASTGFTPQPSAPLAAQQPAPALAYAPQAASAATAPAAQAINTATYGSTPLNVDGKMLTRQQAEDNDGTDHTDYDAAAAKAGIIANAKIAPPFVDKPGTGSAPAVVAAGAPAAAAPQAGAAPSASQSGAISNLTPQSGVNSNLIRTLLSNPDTQQFGLQLWQQQATAAQNAGAFSQYKDSDGSIWQRDNRTGAVSIVQDNSKETSDWKIGQGADGTPFEYNSKTAEIRPIAGTPGVVSGTKTHVIGPGGALVNDQGTALYSNNGGGNGGLDDQTTDFLAQRVAAGDTTALIGLGRGAQGAANIAAVQKRAAQLVNNNMGLPPQSNAGTAIVQAQADRAGALASARTEGTLSARQDTFATEATGAINLAGQASNAVPRGNWVPVNKVVQMVQAGTSDPALLQFNAANNAVINTYAKAISPSGVPTDSDKQHAREMLSTAQGPDGYNAVLQQLQREVNIAHNSARNARAAERAGTAANDPVGTSGQAVDPNIAAARQAIADGKSRAAVIQRLKDNGIDPSGL